MAFQGKGILGNFKGKVGNIVGVVLNGKGIIRKVPVYKERVLFFRKNFINQVFVEPVLAVVGEYFVVTTVGGPSWSKGARSEIFFKHGPCGIEAKQPNMNPFAALCLGNNISNYSYFNQQYSFLAFSGRLWAVVNGVIENDLVIDSFNYKLRIEVDQNGALFSYNNGDGVYITLHQSTVKPIYPLYGIVSARSTPSGYEDIQMGNYKLVP